MPNTTGKGALMSHSVGHEKMPPHIAPQNARRKKNNIIGLARQVFDYSRKILCNAKIGHFTWIKWLQAELTLKIRLPITPSTRPFMAGFESSASKTSPKKRLFSCLNAI
jgi:hypothetical protein